MTQALAITMQVPPNSYLGWMVQAVGPFYLVVLSTLGLLLFAGGLIVVAGSRRPGVIAACLAFVPLPLLISLVGMLHGMTSAFSVIAVSGVTPQPGHVYAGTGEALVFPFLGLCATIPGLVVLASGLLFRTMTERREGA
jgi:hypothetical protein